MMNFKRGLLYDEDPENTGAPPSDGGLPEITPASASGEDNELATLRKRIKDTEARLEEVRNRPVVMQPPPQPRQQVTKKDIEDQFWRDPLQTVAGAMELSKNQTLQQVAPVMSEFARSKAREEDPELFDMFKEEITARVNEVAAQIPSAAMTPIVWHNAFKTIVGENVNKVIEVRGKRDRQPAGAPDGPIGVNTRSAPPPAKPKLSDDELLWAKKFKQTPEQYAQGKAFIENQDAWWGKMFTFDSDDPEMYDRQERSRRRARTQSK